MKKKYVDISLIVSFLLFTLVTLLVLVVDVKDYGLTNTKIGLYSINTFFNDLPKNMVFDKVSDIIMYFALATVLFAVGLGIYQLCKNKSLKKVDADIYYFGLFIIIMAIVWVIFDKVLIINYRPILIDDKIEGSYPSTHVMVVTFLLLGCSYFLDKTVNNKIVTISSYVAASILILLTLIFRVTAGMHWFTDVISGLLAGTTLFTGFLGIVCLHKQKVEKKKE